MSSSNVATKSTLSTGAIIGIVVGSLSALILLVFIIMLVKRRSAVVPTPNATFTNAGGPPPNVPRNIAGNMR